MVGEEGEGEEREELDWDAEMRVQDSRRDGNTKAGVTSKPPTPIPISNHGRGQENGTEYRI